LGSGFTFPPFKVRDAALFAPKLVLDGSTRSRFHFLLLLRIPFLDPFFFPHFTNSGLMPMKLHGKRANEGQSGPPSPFPDGQLLPGNQSPSDPPTPFFSNVNHGSPLQQRKPSVSPPPTLHPTRDQFSPIPASELFTLTKRSTGSPLRTPLSGKTDMPHFPFLGGRGGNRPPSP